MKEVEISEPLTRRIVESLEIGDIIYYSGMLHTLRDMVHQRVLEAISRNEPLPFNLKNGAVWHCGPIARKVNGKWKILSAGPTSSSRFTELGSKLVREFDVRVTVGKGVMGSDMLEAVKKIGSVFLIATGGCAALYAQRIVEVENVHWLDLGIPEAVWAVKVKNFGPLTVGIDSQGRSLSSVILNEVNKNISHIFEKIKIDMEHDYIWWPKHVMGSKWKKMRNNLANQVIKRMKND